MRDGVGVRVRARARETDGEGKNEEGVNRANLIQEEMKTKERKKDGSSSLPCRERHRTQAGRHARGQHQPEPQLSTLPRPRLSAAPARGKKQKQEKNNKKTGKQSKKKNHRKPHMKMMEGEASFNF